MSIISKHGNHKLTKQTTNLIMNQKRKKSGFFLNRSKRPKKPSEKPSTCLRKQHRSCFSMHSHPVIFSIMCRCSYPVKKEHPNKPVEPPIEPVKPQNQQQWHQNLGDSISTSPREAGRVATTLITKYDYSRKSEASPSTPSKASMIKRGKLKKRVTIGSNQTSTVIDGSGGGGDEAEWPPSTDEDYIVFCFEEDGEFHVVMEENGNSDVSPTPHNLKVEEERFYFSPRLQSDGIRSSTRFKHEAEHEEMSRHRVDEEKECKEMDEIKSRGPFDDDQEQDIDFEEDVEFRDTSMECVHGSTESSGSIGSDWEQILQVNDADEEIRLSSSSLDAQEDQMPNEERKPTSPLFMTESDCQLTKKMVDDEESVYLSSESQQEESQDSEEHSNNDEQSGRESSETSETSRSEIIEEEKFDDHEESARNSVVSSKCSEDSDRISSSSFEFPALPWEWIGSPDIWPKSETPTSIRFRKQKSHKVCLRLCRF